MIQEILEHSLKKFITSGYGKVTTDELSGDMGISKKTLYKFFETKDKLIEAAVDHLMKKVQAKFDKVINEHKRNSIDRLNEIFFMIAEFGSKMSKDAMRDINKHRPDLIQKLLEFRAERVKSLASVIRDGQARGEIRKEIDPELTIEVFLAALNTIMVPGYLINSTHSFDSAFKNIFSIFLTGIEEKKTDKPTEQPPVIQKPNTLR